MAVSVLGTTDDVTSCGCCGKQDLKGTVALSFDDADPVYYGVICAARAIGWEAAAVRKAARRADDDKARAAYASQEAARRLEDSRWQSFLDASSAPALRGVSNRFRQIESLGGYAAARALYERSPS